MNFYILLEKTQKNCDISATLQPISTKFGMMMQNVIVSHIKNVILKIQDGGRTADMLE